MPIDFSKPAAYKPEDIRNLLESIQGNILKGHGRDHTIHIFVKFNDLNAEDLRQKLVAPVRETVKSAWQQHIESEQFRKYKIPGAIFGNIFLTAKGYRALGFSDKQIKSAFSDEYFQQGMKAKHADFNDPPPAKWEEGYRQGEIDAMFLLADDDRDYLLRRGRDLVNALDEFCEILAVERGDALRNRDNNEGIEHFGYVDGRSQPIYLANDLAKEGTTNHWNPIEPLDIVLTRDKLAGKGNWGSYFVFRKLEQDVLSFKTREQKLADELGFTTREERERAGALAVGRFEDGTPVVLSPTDGYIPLKENDFNYSIDDDKPDPQNPKKKISGGLKCPFQAHIRKTNPRGDNVRRKRETDREERDHRITRRGITYGERKKHPNDAQALSDYPTKGVGLLFMCFQADIKKQFAFIQKVWANNSDFVEDKTGLDPIIGQGDGGDQKWRSQYGQAGGEEIEFSFQGFVEMKGGEFFFAPSMKFLETFGSEGS